MLMTAAGDSVCGWGHNVWIQGTSRFGQWWHPALQVRGSSWRSLGNSQQTPQLHAGSTGLTDVRGYEGGAPEWHSSEQVPLPSRKQCPWRIACPSLQRRSFTTMWHYAVPCKLRKCMTSFTDNLKIDLHLLIYHPNTILTSYVYVIFRLMCSWTFSFLAR